MEERIIHAYMLFMWNADIPREFINIFDGGPSDNPYSLGNHILNKWYECCDNDGRTAAAATLWPELDTETRAKIVSRAMEIYGGECGIK